MDLEGKILGNRYEIIEKIGNGGMATVYKSKDRVLNRYVAVKILRDEFTTDEEFIKRFRIEAQSAASLTHPNIVSIFDVGNEGNLYYIVMELIKGKTLKEIITEENGPLPWKWSLNVVTQIASALETAHKNNIVHRDIKPHNIIITEDGIAKVTDFGIAKAVSNSTITAFGTTIGSVHYFSPEHARGGFTDAKSDLYSLGVVMYEMLTGKVPFDADTPVSVALKHMQEKPVEPKELNENIPQVVNDIIMKAMQKDINLRYQSATEMVKDLNTALKNPDENFVHIGNNIGAATQRISTQEIAEAERRANEKNNKGKEKKSNKFLEFIKKHKVASAILGAILLFFIAFGATMGIVEIANPNEVQIPDLVNKTEEEAEQILKDLKLKLVVKSEEYDENIEKGKIISQDPTYKENYKIKEHSEISVIISKGTEKVDVPNVVGKTKEEAEKELKDAGLVPEIIEENDEKVEAGIVLSQDPEDGENVNKGSKVKLVVSKGSAIVKVEVPSLVGKNEQEAKALLAEAGLKANIINDEDDSKNDGVVLRQSKEAGTQVQEGTTITITVNKVSQAKETTFTIDVKKITGGYDKDETGNNVGGNKSKTVDVIITVNGKEAYRQSNVDKNSTITAKVSGKGSQTVVVTLKDDKGENSRSTVFNFNTSSTYTFN
ncbi:MAG: Stk1 family PASTA domain-containing Ser/Thr kinase [Clostridia bacterium]|jgi:probable serine/threonine-protein kinase sps1